MRCRLDFQLRAAMSIASSCLHRGVGEDGTARHRGQSATIMSSDAGRPTCGVGEWLMLLSGTALVSKL